MDGDATLAMGEMARFIQYANNVRTTSYHTVVVSYSQPMYATGGEVSPTPIGLADGGFPRTTGQVAGHDTSGSDDVKAMLTMGEFVQPVSAVDYYGRDFMNAVRFKTLPKDSLPKFATGGSVGGGSSGGGANSSSDLGTLTLQIGSSSFEVMTSSEVAASLTDFIVKQGGM